MVPLVSMCTSLHARPEKPSAPAVTAGKLQLYGPDDQIAHGVQSRLQLSPGRSLFSLLLLMAMFALVFLLGLTAIATVWGLPLNTSKGQGGQSPIAPKVFIIDLFDEEGSSWFGIPEFNVLEKNITVPGFSPLFPQAHCTQDGSICQLVTGEAEINAASTITTLVHSSLFDLTRTYFLIAGIAGINPKVGTLGSVTFARYAVQVGLQNEFDAREKPVEFPTGYVPQGAFAPDQFPPVLYGTEVFEVNDDLRQIAIELAKTGKLADNSPSRQYRANYASNPAFASGAAPPSVIACDTATADVFWTGNLLGEAFENTTRLFTNGSATYCTTQQEDNGTLEALLRGASAGLVDFSRIIIMRTASDFDRPFPGENAATNLFLTSPGFDISLQNIPAAGAPIVTGIVSQWSTRFEGGIEPSHYIGDIFGTLGGTPDFGPGSIFGGKPAVSKKRTLRRRTSRIVISD